MTGKNMGLARRRADAQRMKAKARRIYPDDYKARYADHLAACSCFMCGNPRRFFGGTERLTMQERRAMAEDSRI